jgi:sugar lactone lactonase YvrE
MSLVLSIALTAASSSAATVIHETVASYPNGSFLENLSAGLDGAVLITSYSDKRILRWTGSGQPAVLVTLDAHPVGILSRADDIIVSAHGAPFTGGPGFLSSNCMLVLDRKGNVLRTVAAPDARFLNGMAPLPSGAVLVADSVAGRIWRFDPVSGVLSVWLVHEALAPDPARPQMPGANGLKIKDGWLYVSNSSRGRLYRVRLDGERSTGELDIFATTGPIDDFAFLPHGSIAATTHGDRLLSISPSGQVGTILEDGCDGCTSVLPYGTHGGLIVLTTGRLLEGGKGSARILRTTPVRP